jgi:hypothetical protein
MENAASVNRKTNLHERNSILKKYYGINGKPTTTTTTQREERPFDLGIYRIVFIYMHNLQLSRRKHI